MLRYYHTSALPINMIMNVLIKSIEIQRNKIKFNKAPWYTRARCQTVVRNSISLSLSPVSFTPSLFPFLDAVLSSSSPTLLLFFARCRISPGALSADRHDSSHVSICERSSHVCHAFLPSTALISRVSSFCARYCNLECIPSRVWNFEMRESNKNCTSKQSFSCSAKFLETSAFAVTKSLLYHLNNTLQFNDRFVEE